jgi:hypothetical protein
MERIPLLNHTLALRIKQVSVLLLNLLRIKISPPLRKYKFISINIDSVGWQDDSYLDSYISTIGVDFVSILYAFFVWMLLVWLTLTELGSLFTSNSGDRKYVPWSKMERP